MDCLFLTDLKDSFLYSGMNLLLVLGVANVFCHFVTCLFTLFMMPLDAHKLLIILLDLLIFSFKVNTFCIVFKKFFPIPDS